MRTLLSIRGFPTGSIPSTIVIDKQGRVAHIWLEAITDPQPADRHRVGHRRGTGLSRIRDMPA